MLGFLIDVGPLKLQHMIYLTFLTGFYLLVFFTNFISLMGLLVKHLTLFCLISVTNNFEWFWIGSLCKKIQVMLVFLKTPFLLSHFFHYTLMTFLMMLSVILLSMLMIPHFLAVTRDASKLEFYLRAVVDCDRK